jgi:hypothetical protein
MCGSVNYPTLKSPERYAVYKITGWTVSEYCLNRCAQILSA